MPEFVYRRVVQCHGCISIWSRYSSGWWWLVRYNSKLEGCWKKTGAVLSFLPSVGPGILPFGWPLVLDSRFSQGSVPRQSPVSACNVIVRVLFGRMVSGKNRGPLARITIELPACHCLAFPPCSHDRVAERRKIRSLDIVEQAVWLIGEFAVGGSGIYTSSLPHLSEPDTPSRHKCRSIV